MIVMLSDENRLSVGYLGTEPSLFRMPVTDSRYIDFPERQKELQEYEERIAASTKTGDEIDASALKMQVELNMDSQSNAIDSEEGVPSATLQVVLTGDFVAADIFVHNSLSVFQIGNEAVVDGSGPVRKSIYMFNMFAEEAVLDHRMTVMALVDNRECCHHSCLLPLKLIGEQTAAQKSAVYKFTLESTEIGMDTNLLFPEFESENQSSIGFRLFYAKEIVSIFVSQKANRYRIQSDNPNLCFVMITELLERIKKLQPDAKIRTNGVPMQLFLKTIADYLEVEKRRELEEKTVKRLSVQMRHVEMILLQKLKSEHEPPATHINVLINHTYRE
uniref:Uncharacterized protein n=1 Tax=Panagrolaimus sp. JU765 TaxID=591449 RepID=A0AC34RDC7_9BILA